MAKPQRVKGKGRDEGKNLWRYQPTLPNGKRPTIHLGAIRESAANKICGMIDDLIGALKNNLTPTPATQRWLLDLDKPVFEKLKRLGLCEAAHEVCLLRERRDNKELVQIPSLEGFREWYKIQREADCELSTVKKHQSSLNNLINYCSEHEPRIKLISDVAEEAAFRFQLARIKERAEATASKDIKVCKTAFGYAVRIGWIQENPFKYLKTGSEVNPEGHFILPIEDYERMIDACPNSTWRTIIALGRIGGLREPSELVNLKWIHVNWGNGQVLVTSPKTKRYGKTERSIPLFARLEEQLADHFELTADKSEYVIDNPAYRHRDANLRTTFNRIREKAGIAKFPNPFRNLRLSAANDVCRAGYTMKVVTEWFGHDIVTALKHYHKVIQADFDRAREIDPFTPKKLTQNPTQARPRLAAQGSAEKAKASGILIIPEAQNASVTPTGIEPVLPA